MNKIVTTNDVSFPFKWVQINSFEDISGLPMSETNNLGRNTITVPCVCMFNRWNLKRNTPLPLDESLTFYEIPVPVQDSSGFVDASMRMAMFVFNFDHNEWIGMNGSVSLPNWAVYYALPICSSNSPDMNNHMDIKEPKERLLRFPNTQRNDVQENIREAIDEMANTLTEANLVFGSFSVELPSQNDQNDVENNNP